jgi:hypothetical protein
MIRPRSLPARVARPVSRTVEDVPTVPHTIRQTSATLRGCATSSAASWLPRGRRRALVQLAGGGSTGVAGPAAVVIWSDLPTLGVVERGVPACRARPPWTIGYISEVTASTASDRLPEFLRRFFWDVPADALTWATWRNFIIGRLLRNGDGHAVEWLRAQLGDAALAEWLCANAGGRLPPARLRYWQLVLSLPAVDVDKWIAQHRGESWGTRVHQ